MEAEKCLYAYDYVDLKDREYVKKHAKKRHLGDIDGKHRYRPRPSTATVVSSLVSLDFPETRAINTTTASRIIADQRKQIRNTFEKTQWKETLHGWSRPSTAMDERVQTPVEVELPQRPQTSVSVSDGTQLQMNQLTLRPFSTGAIRKPSRKPPQASGFMWVRMKRRGSAGANLQFKRITEEIRLQWEEEDKKQRQDHRQEKSQSPRRYDAFAGQWLTFAAGGMDEHHGQGEEEGRGPDSGGVVEAFTGETNSEYYNIEGKIGADVANQLRMGNKIRIGVNGKIQSDSLRVRKWRKEVERAESIASDDSYSWADSDFSKLNGQTTKLMKKDLSPVVPLCWDDQLHRPDVKVIEVKDKPSPSTKPDLSERHPVVFEKLVKDDARPKRGPKLETYRLSHRTKSKRNLDGTESLSNRITVITVDQVDEDRESLCSLDYEEILQRSLEVEPATEDEAPSLLRHPEDGQKIAPTDRVLLSPFAEGLVGEPRNGSVSGIKPSGPSSSPRHSAINTDTRLVTRSMTPKPRTVPLTSPVPSSPSIVSGRPRTGSQTSQRAQSSGSKGRYSFSQPPTPRNLNSPHPNLVKPGQLPRTGVSSINPGIPEGEHEYIKISQPILPGSERTQSRMDNLAAIARVGEKNAIVEDYRGSSVSLGRNPSVTSLDSMDSLNVQGGQVVNQLPDDLTEPPCSCSPEAKRAVSAALSRVSRDSSNVINIPTADMNMSMSDLNSMSDMDPLASYSSFRGSLSSDVAAAEADLMPEEEAETRDLIDEMGSEQVDRATRSLASSPSSQHLPSPERQEVGYIINKVDGLELRQSPGEPREESRKTASAKKPNRTVTFAEEIQTPSVPNCTPESTPRDPTDVDSVKSEVDTDDSSNRPQSSESNQSATDELSVLRSKIKSDLVETQRVTQHDLAALEARGYKGKGED
ncbi:uncharacterized protein LOC110989631 [Acanthaster planci]|uniref:Uncharacterized protein LOC110989631 n=1 Tax=Acanthaster planci TaxID=133434 RepID=A0A8B7ZYM6_ACAPL|nr:uncharacterized protein LOC110989631 [Acanthaster planci]